MAPKQKEYSNEVRSLIIKHEIASNMLVPCETIRYIIQKYKTTKCYSDMVAKEKLVQQQIE